jgi:hypothetical protein
MRIYEISGFKVYAEGRDPADFVQGLSQLYMDNQNHTGYSCMNLTILNAINRALTSNQISRYGYMFVFTNGQAQLDYNSLITTYDMLEASRVQVGHDHFSLPHLTVLLFR